MPVLYSIKYPISYKRGSYRKSKTQQVVETTLDYVYTATGIDLKREEDIQDFVNAIEEIVE